MTTRRGDGACGCLLPCAQEPWKKFLAYIAPPYKVMSANKMWSVLCQLDQDITAALDERLQRKEPWFLCSDSATSKGHGLVSFDISNAQDECFQLATISSGYAQQTSGWLKGHLRSQVARIPVLAGISQDTARNCRKAFRDLHAEMEGDAAWRTLFYIDCGEHVAQLVAQDISKTLPWVKDCRGVEFGGARHLGKF